MTVNYNEDIQKAQNLMLEAANEITKNFMDEARKEYNKFKNKYYIKLGMIKARTFISITDNFVEIDLRYVTDYRLRKDTNSKIYSLILKKFNENNIKIASSSMNITLKDDKK